LKSKPSSTTHIFQDNGEECRVQHDWSRRGLLTSAGAYRHDFHPLPRRHPHDERGSATTALIAADSNVPQHAMKGRAG
jgi:hypothetical protein